MTTDEARILARKIAIEIDHALKLPRDPKNTPTDGQVATMVFFQSLDRSGLKLVRK